MSEVNSSGERLYKDINGAKCNIRGMIRREPEWVASRFKAMEDALADMTERAEKAEAVVANAPQLSDSYVDRATHDTAVTRIKELEAVVEKYTCYTKDGEGKG